MGTTYNANIVRNGLILYLDAANIRSYSGTGTSWADLSETGIGGTLVNSPSYTSNNKGGIVFDGLNDYVQVPYNSILAPTLGITVSAWVSTNWQTTSSVRIASKTEGGGWNLAINDVGAGLLSFAIMINGSYRFATVNKTTVSAGFHNIVGTCDARYVNLYIDSVLVGTADRGVTFPQTITYSNNNSLIIGAEASGGTSPAGQYINATISNFSMYNRALTPTEIQKNFNALRGRYNV